MGRIIQIRKPKYVLFSRREIPDDYHDIWFRTRWEHNRRFLKITAVLSLLAAAVIFLLRTFLQDPDGNEGLDRLYLVDFAMLGLVSVVSLVGSFSTVRRGYTRGFEIVQRLVITAYLVLYCFLSYLDLQITPEYSALVILILFLSVAFWIDLFTYLGYLALIAVLMIVSYRSGIAISVSGGELYVQNGLFMVIGVGMYFAVSEARIRNFVASRQLECSIEEMKELSLRDPLTLLYNRRMMNEELDREMAFSRRTGHPLTLFLIDVDHFKRVNDSLGHSTGDDVLRQCAQRLVDEVRESDRVYRFGGEEFILMLPNSSLPSTRALADRLLARFSENRFDGVPWPITISIGIADNTERLLPADLIKLADCRMYQAKQSGRNCYDSTSCADQDGDINEPVIP